MPPKGLNTVEYSIGERVLSFRRPPANKPISALDIPFHTVLEAVDIDNIIKIVSAILCERQILMHSSQLSLLAETAEVLKALIYPFNWEIIYIPVLPEALVGVLEAPMSYFVGLPTEAFERLADIPEAAVVVDVDNNLVTVSDKHPIHEIPSFVRSKLRKNLAPMDIIYEKRGEFWKETKLQQMDWAFKESFLSLIKFNYNNNLFFFEYIYIFRNVYHLDSMVRRIYMILQL